MEDVDLIYYDAHVKTHQRHVLISWLDDERTEKLKKLKEEKTDIKIERVFVPKDIGELEELDFEPELSVKLTNIDDNLRISVSENNNIDFVPEIGLDNIELYLFNDEKIEQMPYVADFSVDIDEKAINAVLPNVIFPQVSDMDSIKIENSLFADIELLNPVITGTIINNITSIVSKEYNFNDIYLGKTELPAKVDFPPSDINKTKLDIFTEISEDTEQSISSYKVSINEEQFESVSVDIVVPESVFELSADVESLFSNKDIIEQIDLPSQVAELKCEIDDESFSGILTPIDKLSQIKLEYQTSFDEALFENIVGDAIELPKAFSPVEMSVGFDFEEPIINVPIEHIEMKPVVGFNFDDSILQQIIVPTENVDIVKSAKSSMVQKIEIPQINIPAVNVIPTKNADIKLPADLIEQINVPSNEDVRRIYFEPISVTEIQQKIRVPKELELPSLQISTEIGDVSDSVFNPKIALSKRLDVDSLNISGDVSKIVINLPNIKISE